MKTSHLSRHSSSLFLLNYLVKTSFKISLNKVLNKVMEHVSNSQGRNLVFFIIRPPPELLPVLGPLERYMPPTLNAALLCCSRAGYISEAMDKPKKVEKIPHLLYITLSKKVWTFGFQSCFGLPHFACFCPKTVIFGLNRYLDWHHSGCIKFATQISPLLYLKKFIREIIKPF